MGPHSFGKILESQPISRSASSGPGGIRTLGLFSAIEARSQLRYRPLIRVAKILPEPHPPVKAHPSVC